MDVVRYATAPRYEAPGHIDMACLRLQGMEASQTSAIWLGLSHLLPGGHVEMKASPTEKLYVVIDGEVTVTTETEEAVLSRLDSCRLAPGEARALWNRTNAPASILLAMPTAS